MINIQGYDFVDCLVADFSIDRLISSLEVVVEAYYPFRPNFGPIREKGLIKIVFTKIYLLSMKINEEFQFDINLPYSKSGDHVKANEVYSVQVEEGETGRIKVIFKSDFLNFDLECVKVDISELP
jgi:hypothetical protein